MLFKSNKNQILLIFCRNLSVINPKPLPVIKVPKYLKTTLNQVLHREQKRAENRSKEDKSKQNTDSSGDQQKIDKNVCLISSNNKKFNHFSGQTYRNRDNIPLISKEWRNGERTNGSRMRFHIYGQNPSKVVKQWSQQLITFDSLGLKTTICEAVNTMAITEPTSIQMAAIPAILDNKNIICSAETGSGKTIAYLAPIIQMIREFKELKSEQTGNHFPKGLVIVPSRELAEQVGRVAQHLGTYCGIGVAVMMGGMPKHITQSGMDLIVSTIGLIQPLINKNVYSFKRLNHLVIDESDTLFDESFGTETLDLLSNVLIKDNTGEDEELPDYDPNERTSGVQLVCVSATMPRNLDTTLGTVVDIENNFEKITSHRLHHIMPHVKQDFYRIHRYERHSKLLELVKKDQRMGRPVMVFSNRSDSANWIYHYLNENGVQCLRLNKKISDIERSDQLKRFQSGECDVISCTDMGSRGLDTVRVRHVINYDCPHFVSDYIHRSGRTGRIGTSEECLVSTLVSFKPDVKMLESLEMALRLNRPIDSVDANIKQQLSERQFSNTRQQKIRQRLEKQKFNEREK